LSVPAEGVFHIGGGGEGCLPAYLIYIEDNDGNSLASLNFSRISGLRCTCVAFFNPNLTLGLSGRQGTKMGTELERVNELMKNALRVTLALSNLEGVSSETLISLA